MRLGIHLPQYGRTATPDNIRRAAIHAEALGYENVWVSDHVVQPASQGYPSPYLFDPLLTLSWAAAATTHIGIGTSVLVVPQYHPLWLANATASLDALSGGRLQLAVGVGWSEGEFAALGQDFHQRGARTDEMLEILRLAWTTDPTSYQGRFFDVDDIRILPKPAHEIPIWIGGRAPAAFRRAQRFGSGFQLIGLTPEQAVEPCRRLRADHPDEEAFTISLRTGWDPLGMDPGLIAAELDAFAAAGIQHVVAAPWRTTIGDWLRAMDELAAIVGLHPT